MFDLSGRVALVSGAAGSLGKAASLGLAEAGADLVLADIDEAGVHRVASEIESLQRNALPVVCDISEPDQIRAIFERTWRRWLASRGGVQVSTAYIRRRSRGPHRS